MSNIPAQKLVIEAADDITKKIYTSYMDNMNMSRQLQIEILKGVTAGENIHTLFLKAAKAISAMTANSAFYSTVERYVNRE